MAEPVAIAGEGLVDAVVEVFVVGEDNVASDIVQLLEVSRCAGRKNRHGEHVRSLRG